MQTSAGPQPQAEKRYGMTQHTDTSETTLSCTATTRDGTDWHCCKTMCVQACVCDYVPALKNGEGGGDKLWDKSSGAVCKFCLLFEKGSPTSLEIGSVC